MRPIARAAVAIVAAAAVISTAGGVATAAKKPTPLQVAASYMREPVKITQKIPLKTAPPRGINAAWLSGPTAQLQQQYIFMKGVTDELGWNLTSTVYDGSNGASIESAFDTVLRQGAQIIMAPALDLNAMSASMKQRIADAKVPVVVGQACPPTPYVSPFFPGSTLCAAAGKEALALANWIAADANGKPVNMLIMSTVQFPQLKLFDTELARQLGLICPSTCKTQTQPITFLQVLGGQGPSIAVNKLRADPSINYISWDLAAAMTALPSVLDAAGMLGKVKIVGKSPDANALTALQNGQEDAWVTTPWGNIAYAFLDSAFRVLTHSSGITLNAAPPSRLLTTVNVKTIPIPYYFAPADELTQFKKLWHMS